MTEPSTLPFPLPSSDESDDPLAKVRAQFDRAPYPRIPLDRLPNETHRYWHDFRTAYYRRHQKIASTEGRLMLDVGCGSGFGVLSMALSNPGARIVGVDLSPASVDLAKKRLDHHGLGDRVEFHALAMDDLPQLDQQFDYINCDELLYLQPDPADGLAAMKAVLKPDGIIRSNLHSLYQRFEFFKAQSLAHLIGLMDDNPGEMEVEVLAELMESLKDDVPLKVKVWDSEKVNNEQRIMMNLLFQRDRGFTIYQLFDYIARADLEFISMSDWQSWDVTDLFKDSENLPMAIAFGLAEAPIEDQLQFHDLLKSNHRLLDFWCGYADTAEPWIPLGDWEPEQWHGAKVCLHPQLDTEAFHKDLKTSVLTHKNLNMEDHISLGWGLRTVSSAIALGLVPLLQGAQYFEDLADQLQRVRPVDVVTLEPIDRSEIEASLRYLLTELSNSGYVLVEAAAA
ncbi:MAG TPA: class I SAM-dependent methyltransferase [Coleofasciculaceae cyanobacterium]